MKYTKNRKTVENRIAVSSGSAIANHGFLNLTEIVFIDSQVEDYQTLLKEVVPGIEAIILDRDRDGIEQITQILNRKEIFSTIHVVAHGSSGCLYLGNSQLSVDTLNKYEKHLRSWFAPILNSLEPIDRNLLLHGCNVAENLRGQDLITRLSSIVGSNVAASTHPVGHAEKGGSWKLDYHTVSTVDSFPFKDSVRQSWQGVLAAEIEEPFDDLVPDLVEELEAASVTTDLEDYAPGSTAIIEGDNFEPGETVELQVLHNDGTPNTGGGHIPWQITDGGIADLDGLVNGKFRTSWYVNPDDSANSAFDLTATGLNSGIVANHSFTDSGGDFSIDFSSAAPFTYNHATGGGAYNDRTVGKRNDVVESLQGGDFACGDIVSYFLAVSVDDAAVGSQTIEVDVSFLADSTGQSGVAHDDIVDVEVNYDLVQNGAGDSGEDTGIVDDGGSEATLVSESINGELFTSKSTIDGTVRVDDLEAGETVVVRIDTHLGCDPNTNPTGTLQGFTTGARVVDDGSAISVGNQTIPFLQVGDIAGAGDPLLKVEKTVTTDLTGGDIDGVEELNVDSGTTVRYLYKVTNSGTQGLYDLELSDDGTAIDPSNIFSGAFVNLDGEGTANDIEPGETIIFYQDVVLNDVGAIATEVTATGNNDASGQQLAVQTEADLAIVNVTGTQGFISGFVYEDIYTNGVREAGEAGIAGAELSLTGRNSSNRAVSLTTTTDVNGKYQFTNLDPSDADGYTIAQVQPDGYDDGADAIGSAGAISSGNDTFTILLGEGEAATGYNFGEQEQTTTVSGFVYDDADDNGSFDDGEVGIPNVEITLTGVDINGTDVNKTAITDSSGQYVFEDLEPSATKGKDVGYNIAQTANPTDYNDGQETLGTINGVEAGEITADDPGEFNIDVVDADTAVNYNFGESLIAASLVGLVVDDGGNGIGDVVITLTGTDSLGNAIEQSVTTNAVGEYQFNNLRASDANGYTITQTQPSGYTNDAETIGTGATSDGTASSNQFTGVVLAAGDTATGYNFSENESANLIPQAEPDTNTSTGILDVATGNVFDNDNLGDTPTFITAASVADGSSITLGTNFVTSQGGILLLSANGSYVYTPPALGLLTSGITEVFNYTITDGNGDSSNSTLTINVNGGNTLPTVELSVTPNSGSEADETVFAITATASAAVDGEQTIDLATTGIDSADYNLSNTTITIADGETTGSVTLTVVDDAEVESDETATFTISNPSAGLELGTVTTADVTITDNDVETNFSDPLDVDGDGIENDTDLDKNNDGILNNVDEIELPEDFIIAGYHFNLVNAPDGKVYVTGQDGKPSGNANEPDFTQITAPEYDFTGDTLKVVGADSSDPQYVLWTTTGLYVWGTQDEVVDSSLTTSTAFQPLDLPAGVNSGDIADITAAPGVLALISNAGEIWIMGSDQVVDDGKIYGDGSDKDDAVWHKVKLGDGSDLTNVVDLDLTANGAFAVTSDGSWYTWGNKATLGDGSAAKGYDVATPMTLPDAFSGGDLPVQIEMTSGSLAGSTSDGGTEASYFALHSNGLVYVIGGNGNGQLGIGNKANQTNWQILQTDDGSGDTKNLENVTYIGGNSYTRQNPAAGAITEDPATGQRQLWLFGTNKLDTLSNEFDSTQNLAANPAFYLPSYADVNGDNLVNDLDIEPQVTAVGGHLSIYYDSAQGSYAFVGHNADGSFGGDPVDGVEDEFTVSTSTVELVPDVLDTDGDGIDDHCDLDLDNDGISNLAESGVDASIIAADTNRDGMISIAEAEVVLGEGNADIDNDGLIDLFDADTTDGTAEASIGTDPVDSDSDGIDDIYDLDSDNDGIPDSVEAIASSDFQANDGNVSDDDADGDGVINLYDANDSTSGRFGGTFTTPVDTDDDGTPDYLDDDSDDDNLTDNAESGLTFGVNSNNGINNSVNANYADPDGDINAPLANADGLQNTDSDTSDVDFRSLDTPTTPTVELSVTPNSGSEADATVFTITATTSAAVDGEQTIDLATTGIDSADYNLSNTTITIADGATTGSVTLTVVDDAEVEGQETATLTISNPSAGLELGTTTTADVTITDNDVAPSGDLEYAIATGQLSLDEGNDSSQTVTFTVTRTGAVEDASTVNFSIGGSATNAEDYSNIGGTSGATEISGTIDFAANETSKTITLDVTGDTAIELDETIVVSLADGTAPNGTATIATPTATAIILNDDLSSGADLTIGDTSATEGDPLVFDLSLSEASTGDLTLDLTTNDGTADSSDRETTDFEYKSGNGNNWKDAVDGTKVTIPNGETSIQVRVDSVADSVEESNETFTLAVNNVVSGNVGDTSDTGEGTILDDDGSTGNGNGNGNGNNGNGGNTGTGTIAGIVWSDTDLGGIRDNSETGVDGVTINLFLKNDKKNPVATTTTSDGGSYEFTVDSGQYFVEFTPPKNAVFSPKNKGNDDSLDSDVNNKVKGTTKNINLSAGETIQIDAGISPDSDGDSIPDAIEGLTGDRDNDGILNYLDVDPAGYFYAQNTGQVLPGGLIDVTTPGIGLISITEDASETGFYQWFIDGTPDTYTMGITAPEGYVISPDRLPETPAIDATSLLPTDPFEMGESKNEAAGTLFDFTEASNPYYLEFELALDDPFIINNNIPFVAPATLDLDESNDSGAADPDSQTTFVTGSGGIAIATDPIIGDLDGTTIDSATITLTNSQTGDILSGANLPNGTSITVDAANSTNTNIKLFGTGTLDEYEAAIASIEFNNTEVTPDTSDRLVDVVINDSDLNSNIATTTISIDDSATTGNPTSDTDSANPEVEFEAGSYVIDMGQDIQTTDNTLKGYGLVYELAFNLNVPVQWAIDSEKEFYDADFTAGGKDYRGGSFIIQEDFITPEVLAIFEDPRFSQVSIDQVNEEFTAPIFDEITSFPKAVLDLQNGGLAIPYFENAGISPLDDSAPDYNPLDEPYIMGTPEDLNGCNDVYVMPHADPDSWPESYKSTMYDFVTEGGWLWAADHAVSALEVTDIAGFGDRFDLNFLGHDDGIEYFKGDPTGAGRYGGHSGGTLPYDYDLTIAGDPEMQVMGLFIDDAITNGSEQIYIPFDADGVAGEGGWLPTTTVAGYDPDHPERLDRNTFPGEAYEATVLAYGPAFGNDEYGNVMYSAGHSYAKGSGAPNVAAQRSFFNFLLQSGRDRQPEIDASEFPSEISSGSSQQLKVTVDSPHGTLTEFAWASTDGLSTFSNQTIQIDPVTGETVLTADFTLNSDSTIVTIQVEDGCGRQSIHSQVFVDPPPVVDLDGDDSTTAGNNFLGTYRGGGVPVAVTDLDVAVSDDSSFIESATISLSDRPDGTAEFLLIDATAAGEVAGIIVTDDGNGGFTLAGRATQGDYQKVIATLQYQNNLDALTEADRVVEVVINDGISDSEPAIATLTLDNAPLANDDAYITNVDTDIAIADPNLGLVNNDRDLEGTDLSVSANTEASNGNVSVNPNGTLNYSPNAGFIGEDTFEYTVVDAVGNETTATVNIYVNPAGNNPPDAVDDLGYSTPGGVPLTVNAANGTLGNDTYPTDSDTDDVTIDRSDRYSANGGTVGVNANGSFEYTPPAGFEGIDTFTYTIADGNGGADTATVEIEVTNAPPKAVDDAFDGGLDLPLTVAVEDGILNNDSDPTDDPFAISAFDSVSANGGTVTVNPNGSFEYIPPAGFEGTDTFTYTIAESAPQTGSDTATVTIEVVRPPVAEADYFGTDKNSTLTIDILDNDTTSSVFDPSSVAIVPGSESWDTNKDKKPKLTVNADGTVDFGFFEGKTEFDTGTYTFDYTVADETGQTTTATVLVVVADKTNPAGVPDFATTSVGTPVTIDITDNDYTENDPAGWNSGEIRTDPGNGVVNLQVNDNGTPGDTSDDYPEAVYTPNAGFTGTDTFEYRVEEGDGDRTEETLVTVTIADQQPTAENDAVTVDEDSSNNIINVVGNDFAGDAPATVTNVDLGNGTAVIVDNKIEYTPEPNFNGIDSFAYTITDNNGDTSTANVSIAVDPVNDLPVATDNSAALEVGETVKIDVTANDDFGGDGAAIGAIALETNPTNGTAVVDNNNTPEDPTDDAIDYTHSTGVADSFTYTITDSNGDTSTATVNLSVNNPPVADDDSYSLDTNATPELTIAIPGVLNNDTDPDSNTLTVDSFDATTSNGGTVTLQPDGSFVYSPVSGFIGQDSFTYVVSDGNGGTDTATVAINVVGTPNVVGGVPPEANNDSAVATKEVNVEIDVLSNDTTAGNFDLATVQVVSGTESWNTSDTKQSLTVDPITGNFTFNSVDNGDFSFTYQVEDNNGELTTAQVNILVSGDGTGVISSPDSTTTKAQSPVTINLTDNDASPVDGWNTPEVRTEPTNGSVTLQVNEQGDSDSTNDTVEAIYVPNPGFTGTDTFEYRANDSNGDTLPDTLVTVTVEPLDAGDSQANNDSAIATQEINVEIDVLSNDTTAGNFNPATVQVVLGTESWNTTDTKQSLTVDPVTGNFTFNSVDNGDFSFTYQVADSNGELTTAQVNILVSGDGTGVTSSPDSATTKAQSPVTINLTDNDSSPVDGWNTPEVRTEPTNGSVTLQVNEQGDADLANDTVEAIYVPNPGFTGTDTFEYRANDSNGDTLPDTLVTVTVEPLSNSDSQANNDSAIATKEVNVEIDVLNNDTTDSSFNPATVQVVSGTESWDTTDTKQSLTIDPATGNFTFNSVDNGDFNFTYQVADNNGELTTAQVNILVSGDGTGVTSSPDTSTTTEDTSVTINLTDNDASPVDGWNTPEVRTEPTNGSVTLQVNEQGDSDPTNDTVEAVYVPNPGFAGTDTFEYRANDSNGDTLPDTLVTVTVEPATSGDRAIAEPTAEDNSATVNEDSVDNGIYVLYDDNFGTDGASTGQINITADPSNGTATVNNNTTPNDPTDDFIEYSPNADFNGADQLTYQITDATGDTAEANLDITVTPVNDLPQASDDSAVTDEGVAVNIPVVAGDGSDVVADDFGGDSAATDADIIITADPIDGTATVNDSGTPEDPTDDTIDYTPNLGFNGTDRLTYQITDANGDTSEADVNITVNDVNNLPVADNETAITDEDVAVNINVTDGDDFGLDGASNGAIEVTTAAGNGTATVNDNGTPNDPTDDTIDYTPGKDFSGVDNFEYTITDSDGDTSIGQVEVTVNPLNDAPNAIANSYTGNEDTNITGNVITDGTGEGIDGDIDGDNLIVTVNTDPANGTVTVSPNGDFTYTPNLNYNGTDGFAYTIADPDGETSSALVNLTIDPVDDVADAIADGTIEVNENSTFNPITVLDNDLGDPDITLQDFTQPANGFVRINNNETPLDASDDFLEYSPDRNYTGTDSFDYTIEDADGQTDTATVSINVNDLPNEAPVANPDTITIDAATAAGAGQDLTFNDSDPNNDPLSILQVEFGGNIETDGEIGIAGNYGALEWVESGSEADYELDSDNPAVQALNIGDSLTDEFIYTLQDTDGATSSTTYTVTILKSNKKPVANNDNYTATDEDAVTTFTTSILANDTDPDPGQTLSILQVNGEPVAVDVPFEVSSGALVTVNNDNTITYDPNGGLDYLNDGETGIDVFQYSISDGNPDTLGGAGIDSALVTVTALGTNDAPVVNLDPDNSQGGVDDRNFATTFTEELSSVSITDSDVTIYDPDNEDFASVTLTINGLVDGSDEILNINGTPFSLNEDTSNTVTVGDTAFAVEITGSGNTVTLTNADAGLDLPRSDLQELLRGITYRNNSDDPTLGNRTIEIVASDGSLDSAVVTSTISVQPVNDAPTVVVPDAQAVSEATPLPLGGISFDDLDAGSEPVTVTLNVSNGILTLNDTVTDGLIAADITDNATASVTVTGTVAQINNTLTAVSGLSYLGNNGFTGNDNLEIVINDGGNSGVDPSTVGLPDTADATSEAANATIPITINAIAGSPADAIANSYSTNEEIEVTGNLITDDDNGADSGDIPLTVTGNTNPANGEVIVNPNGEFTYTPDIDFVGTDTFTYTLLDNDGDADTASVSIVVDPVNDAPENTIPGEQSLLETETVVFNTNNGNALAIADIDAEDNDVRVTLTATNGTLTALGDTTNLTLANGIGTNEIILEGSQSLINTALEGLTYTPDGAGAGSIEIKTNDLGNTGVDPSTLGLPDTGDANSEQDLDTVNITTIAIADLNTPPVNTVPVAQTTGESAPGVFQDIIFSDANGNAISITDSEANPATDIIEVTLTATNGTIDLATADNLNVTGGADNSETVTVEGTVNDINTALEGASYSPTAAGNGSVQITTNDLGVAGIDPSEVGQADTGSNSDERDIDTVNITTVPFENINQAPVNTIPTAQTTADGTDLVFNTDNGNSISINDADAGSNDVRVILTATEGDLSTLGDDSGLTSAAGVGTNEITLIGSQSSINIALEGLTYTPTDTGTGSIAIQTNDLGNTGADPSTVGLPNTADATSEQDTDSFDIAIETVSTTGTISSLVWEDTNFDGIKDVNENALDGVTVELYDADGNLQDTDITASGGQYEFTDLPTADYYLEFTAPENYVFSPQNKGNDETIDSDVNRATGQTDILNIGAGDSLDNLSAGLAPDSEGDTIPDAVEGFTGDRDGDGILNYLDVDPAGYFYSQKTGEVLSGGLIEVSGAGAINIADDANATGFYQWFIDGTPDTYTMDITPPPGYILSPNRLPGDSALDATGLNPDPFEIGESKDDATGKLFDFTEANNPYYLDFELALGDPFVINNNIPFVAPPTLDLDGDNDLTGNDYETTYTVGGSPISIADDVLLGDLDDDNLQSATIYLKTRPDGDAAESLVVNGALPGNITTAGFDDVTGILELTGNATIAEYQTAIAQIEYTNTIGLKNNDRLVDVTVNDGISDSNVAMTTIAINQPPFIDLDGDNSSFL